MMSWGWREGVAYRDRNLLTQSSAPPSISAPKSALGSPRSTLDPLVPTQSAFLMDEETKSGQSN